MIIPYKLPKGHFQDFSKMGIHLRVPWFFFFRLHFSYGRLEMSLSHIAERILMLPACTTFASVLLTPGDQQRAPCQYKCCLSVGFPPGMCVGQELSELFDDGFPSCP